MSLMLSKYDAANAVTVGAVHTAIDYFGVAGKAQPLNSRAAAKAVMSAASDLAGTVFARNFVPVAPSAATPEAAAAAQKQMWVQLLASGAAYPLVDMASDIDNRPAVMQFLLQAGSSFVGAKAYQPIAAWAMAAK
jgi:hypothetical protein